MSVGISSLRYKLLSTDNKVDFLKNVSSIRTGLYQDCFQFAGRPVAGSFTADTSVGLFYNSGSIGALKYNNTTGSIYIVGSKTVSNNIFGSESPILILYDRLWSVSINLKITTEQSFVDQDYTSRYSPTDQLFAWIEVTADSGTMTNDSTVSLKYLNENNSEIVNDTPIQFRSALADATNNCDAGNLHFLGLKENDILKSVRSIRFSGTVGASAPTANLVVGKLLNIFPSTPEDQSINSLKHGIINIHSSSCLSVMGLWQTVPSGTETLISKFNFINI